MTFSLTDIGAKSHPSVHVALDHGVLTIGLGHEGADLLWTVSMIDCFCDIVQGLSGNESVRVLVIQSEGKDFCLGLDAQDFVLSSNSDRIRVHASIEKFQQCCQRGLQLLNQPVIAQVQGNCHAAGIRLLEGCDIVLADDHAQFVFDAKDSELMSLSKSVMFEPQLQSMSKRAKTFYTFTHQIFDGREAARTGLATLSFPGHVLRQETHSLATLLSEKDRLALQFTKETLAHVGAMSWDASVNFTAAKFAELKSRQSGEGSMRVSAVASFLAGQSKPGKGV